jgi:DNA polymerase III subunit delta'
MLFSQVIGQQEIKTKLRNIVEHNRLSHALLLNAPEGAGGLPLALAFSQFLVCERVTQTGSENEFPAESCGICPACIKAAKMVHPDIHYSYPVVSKKPGDKPVSTDFISDWREFISLFPYGTIFDWLQFIQQSEDDKKDVSSQDYKPGNKQGNITAHECHEINRKLSLKSFESGYKILIMWMPEYLGNEGNRLLKLIEEPPPDTLFLLVTENETLILPTILSRVQIIRLPRPSAAEIQDALISRAGVAPEQARQLAAVSEQNYREALSQLQHAPDDWLGLLREWLNAVLKTGPVAQVKWVEEISKTGREKQKQFLQYFIHLLEQGIRLRMMDREPDDLPETEKDFAIRLNKTADLAAQQAIVKELNKSIYFIERNAHAKMLFHALTIRLYHILAAREEAVIT